MFLLFFNPILLGTNNTQKISQLIIIVLTPGTPKTHKGGGGGKWQFKFILLSVDI